MLNLKTSPERFLKISLYSLIFSFLTSTQISLAKYDLRNLNILRTLKTYATKIDKFLEDKAYQLIEYQNGQEDASPEVQKFIQDIAYEMDYKKNIKVKKFNKHMLLNKGRHNAMAISQSRHDYVYLDEDFFNNLTLEEKRFLAGHEVSHLIKDHIYDRAIIILAGGAISGYTLYKALQTTKTLRQSYETTDGHALLYYESTGIKKYLPKLVWGMGSLGVSAATYLYLLKISRSQEYEADRLSAIKLNSTNGGISLLKFWQSLEPNYTLNEKVELLLTHPLGKNRIKPLEELLKFKNQK